MKRSLGFLSVLGLGINTIVGSGIFRLPAEMAHALGPASMLVFVLCALALSVVALAYAEAASLFDSDGGTYLYAKAAFGEPTGFLVGWTVWLATVLTWATVAVAIPGQLGVAPYWAGVVIVALGLVNLFGVQPAAWVSNVFAAVKLVPLVAFVLVGIWFVRADHFTPFAPMGWHELPTTVVIAFFALSGFETAAIPGGGGAPAAIVASLVGSAILYALIQFVAIGVDPNVANSAAPLADASRAFLGDASGQVIAVAGAVSMLGLCTAMALTAPLLFTKLIPRVADKPSVAFSTGVTVILAYAYDFRGLVGFTSVTLILQYLATCLAVPVLRKTMPHKSTLPLPILLLACVGLCYLLTLCQWSELVGAAVVLSLGLLIYVVHRMQKS